TFEHPHRPLDVRIHVALWLLDRGDDVANAGEMKNIFHAGKNRRIRFELAHILPVAFEIRVALDVLEVAAMAADQIIDDANRKTGREQRIDHVATDKSGATGNNRNGLSAHAALSFFSSRTL